MNQSKSPPHISKFSTEALRVEFPADSALDSEINEVLDKLTSDEIEVLLKELETEERNLPANSDENNDQKDVTLVETADSNLLSPWESSNDTIVVDDENALIGPTVKVEKQKTPLSVASNQEITSSITLQCLEGSDSAPKISNALSSPFQNGHSGSLETLHTQKDVLGAKHDLRKKPSIVSRLGIFSQGSLMPKNPINVVAGSTFATMDRKEETTDVSVSSDVGIDETSFSDLDVALEPSCQNFNIDESEVSQPRGSGAKLAERIGIDESTKAHQFHPKTPEDALINVLEAKNLINRNQSERECMTHVDNQEHSGLADESDYHRTSKNVGIETRQNLFKLEDFHDNSANNLYLDDSICSEEYTQESIMLSEDILINPVHEELKLEPAVKELILDPILRRGTNATNDDSFLEMDDSYSAESSKELTDELLEQWIKSDDDQLFTISNRANPLDHSQKLCELDLQKLPEVRMDTTEIYISEKVSNPSKILNLFANASNFEYKEARKIRLYLDFSFVDLQAYKSFQDTVSSISQLKSNEFFLLRLDHIEVKLRTHDKQNSRFILEQLKKLGTFYNRIKILGLFQLVLDQKDACKSSCSAMSELSNNLAIRLPTSLEKFVLANRLDLDDNLILVPSLKSASFYNCQKMNLSKFNLTRRLEQLHICVGKFQLIELVKNGRTEQFLIGLTELRELKLTSQFFMSTNLEKNTKLQTLTLAGLDFKTTRNLRLPQSLKKLHFENCMVSSHLVAFPSGLRKLKVRGGKWKEQRILTFSQLKALHIENVEATDLIKKVNFPRGLSTLKIIQCKLKSLDGIRFSKSLRHADFSFNEIQSISGVPNYVHTLNMEGNFITEIENDILQQLTSLKVLNMSDNTMVGRLESPPNLEELILCKNSGLNSVEFSDSIKEIDVSCTGFTDLSEIFSATENVKKLKVDGCPISKVDVRVSKNLVDFNLSNCHITDLNIKFAPKALLKTLDLSGNELHHIGQIDPNNSIEQLNLLKNQITLVRGIELPKYLLSLDLSDNFIEKFDVNVPASLKDLNLRGNNFLNICEVSLSEGLRTLDLSNNSFGTITSDFATPPCLVELHLENCSIYSLSMKITPSLARLNLSNNKLYCKSFELYPEEESKTTELQTVLDLTGNFFKEINFETLHGAPFTFIKLSNNMFDEFPPEIPAEILAVVFNDVPGAFVKNF
ncbi:L domain-like protein [Suhomyces tanzawaensis NRRL Y-17324]|uniref:L domain-like protein n=1 Tax=Suhomyces tanzawaensis NRRL Y-17324 TaxID=984487 RepID=A0A1E4SSD2_9ASCO|nr:L domain-like protein [Suhomyces tanzawaensis NRRL Y-17324]ODV82429.1 L domain-like protein [Suhomyces tanzawaensis NRRL Y-17324]